MNDIRFNSQTIKQLSALDAIEKVTFKQVFFTDKFKIYAVKQKEKGFTAIEIFEGAGVKTAIFPKKYFSKVLSRWVKNHKNVKTKAFNKVMKPKFQVAKPGSLESMTFEEIKTRVAYLEAENEFLKKLKGLEKLD